MSDWLAGCGPGTAFTGWTKDGSIAWPLNREWVKEHPEWRGPRTGYFGESGMSEFDSKVTFACGCTWSGPTSDALNACPKHGSPRSKADLPDGVNREDVLYLVGRMRAAYNDSLTIFGHEPTQIRLHPETHKAYLFVLSPMGEEGRCSFVSPQFKGVDVLADPTVPIHHVRVSAEEVKFPAYDRTFEPRNV